MEGVGLVKISMTTAVSQPRDKRVRLFDGERRFVPAPR